MGHYLISSMGARATKSVMLLLAGSACGESLDRGAGNALSWGGGGSSTDKFL
jgi:hypothetical protein